MSEVGVWKHRDIGMGSATSSAGRLFMVASMLSATFFGHSHCLTTVRATPISITAGKCTPSRVVFAVLADGEQAFLAGLDAGSGLAGGCL